MDPNTIRKTRLQECDQGIDVGGFVREWKTFQKGIAHMLFLPTIIGLGWRKNYVGMDRACGYNSSEYLGI